MHPPSPGSSTEDGTANAPVAFSFTLPKKEISMVPDMGKWKRSQTVEKLLDLLETLDRWIDETPPVDQPSRFGNKAYRTWYGKLDQVGSPYTSLVTRNDTHTLHF
ncbi:hypothetical protein CRUP_007141 [Coryphaenoides rupestris]|nr:hypothetical protein CRUP_007141 [Coryphaenoides rupestris]